MKKQTVSLQSALVWNPANKEPWHLEFDKEPVNDDRWTCVVTAMIPAKPEDDECIQVFTESVNTGLRKSIKVITMAQVIKILKEKKSNDKSNKSKTEEASKSEKRKPQNTTQSKPLPSRTSPIVNLVSKYATFTENGCQIPVDLTAAIIKHLILCIKEENVFRMKVDAVKEKKIRENNIRINFIKSMKPFKAMSRENFAKNKNENCKADSINDEPSFGPDLYIVLTDFYDPFCFSELNKINVPFLAFLKISNFKEIMVANSQISFANKPETLKKKENLIFSFWKILKENCLTLEKTLDFKDFLFLQYRPQFPKTNESKLLIRDVIFDDLSWMLYSVFVIYRQHQTYLRETHVQSMVVSLEPLNLSECRVYNDLCDSLVTGMPGSIFFILYAIVEQVANSVPYTKSVVLQHEPNETNCFQNDIDLNVASNPGKENSEIRDLEVITPCSECRNKKFAPMSMPEIFSEESVFKTNKWAEEIKKNNGNNISNEKIEETTITYQNSLNDDSSLNLSLLNETYNKPEIKNKKILENPNVISCLYGDKLTFYNTHCDLKLIDLNSIFSRFLERTDVPQIWSKYPALSIGSRFFYNFHFQRLLETTQDTRDLLKTKIFFTLLMKYIGVTKSYLYKGEEENLSQSIRTPSREKFKKLSKVKFDQLGIVRRERDHDRNFSSYFFRLFVATSNRKKVTMKTTGAKREDKRMESIAKTESTNIRKAISALHMSLVSHRNSGYCFPYFFKVSEGANASSSFNQSKIEKDLITFQSLLECYDLISLSDSHTLGSGDEYANLITKFNFFEKLEPRRMVQRLLEAKEEFNTTQCSYFAPTDSLIILIHNDCDHRGIFFTSGYGALLTPVSLRDFYNHVYLDIKEWLAAERKQYNKFVTEMEERAKDLRQKQNKEYLSKLTQEFEAMNEEEKEKFLASYSQSEQSNCRTEFEIKEDELQKDLPIKPKPQHPNKISFLATKFLDVRVETERKVHEIHSRDGTEVNVIVDSWLYESNHLLTLSIKRSNLRLYYHQWMEQNFDTNFFLRTSSDIYFVFYKKYQEKIENPEAKYHIKISWPTGLMLENIVNEKTGTYVKQYYIKVYRKWRNLEKEKYRCFLKCGQILIFYENGDVQVLCASGTKHVIKELPHTTRESGSWSPDACRVQTITTTGQIWEKNGIGHYMNKKKLIGSSKVHIGVDSKTQEIYYRRDDGLHCMLWPNGKLVTTFFDGTKITSTPYFEQEEVTIEWSEEEKLYFEHLKTNYLAQMSEIKPKSKTILKNLSPDSLLTQTNFSSENKEIFDSDGFVSVSLSYLMEHPQYSTVYYDFQSLETNIKMPGQLSIKIDREQNYLINQGYDYLAVKKSTAEFYTLCPDCFEKSIVTIYFDSDNQLCKFVDLMNTEFFINRNGEITYHENFSGIRHSENDKKGPEKPRNFSCKSDHIKPMSKNQRCFVLERNLSGIEFLHSESLARYCFKLPENTYYDLNNKYNASHLLTHVFSSPYYSMAYENWKMSYENENNSMPTNLKKGDLKELGSKDNCKNLFKYSFHTKQLKETEKQCKIIRLNEAYFNVPKIIVSRVIKCLTKNPKTVIDEVKNYVSNYQKGIHNITSICKRHKKFDDESCFNCMKTLEKLVIPPKIYWWTLNSETSTEIDIHNSIHFTNLMQEFKDTVRNPSKNWLKCKHNFHSYLTNENTVPIYEKANSFTGNV